MSNYKITDQEIIDHKDYVETMLGAPVVQVELESNAYEHTFNIAIEEYSNQITQWAIKSHIANALGLPSAQDFTLRWVSQDFEFSKSFAKAYSEQANVGGDVPIYKDYFTIYENKQTYYLPNDIQVNEVLWQEPVAMDRYLMNPNDNPSWVHNEFGWGYHGEAMRYVTPVFYKIQLANDAEMRHKIIRGDYDYSILPAGEDVNRESPDYTGRTKNSVNIYPTPTKANNGIKVWYFYKKDEELNRYSEQTAGDLVSTPGTIKYDEIPYALFNSSAKRWVKQFAFAGCKEVLGRIRSKFSSVPIPDAEISLDGDQLLQEASEEKRELLERLFAEMEEMDINKMLEDEASSAANIHETLSYNPTGIYLW